MAKGDSDAKALELAMLYHKIDNQKGDVSIIESMAKTADTVETAMAMLTGNKYDNYKVSFKEDINDSDLKKGEILVFNNQSAGKTKNNEYITELKTPIKVEEKEIKASDYYIEDVSGNKIRFYTPHDFTISNYNESAGTVTITDVLHYVDYTLPVDAVKKSFYLYTMEYPDKK